MYIFDLYFEIKLIRAVLPILNTQMNKSQNLSFIIRLRKILIKRWKNMILGSKFLLEKR